MKKNLILTAITMMQLTTAYAGWFDLPSKEEQEAPRTILPFDRQYLEPYVQFLFEDPYHNARTLSYKFKLKPKKDAPQVYKGHDKNLNVKVSMEFCETRKPLNCIVKYKEEVYYPSDIWMYEISLNKKIYIVSFCENDTLLVVYKTKDRDAYAQWVLPYSVV